MKLPSAPGRLLLSIWLIATGLVPLLHVSFPALGTIMAILAIASGVFLLMEK